LITESNGLVLTFCAILAANRVEEGPLFTGSDACPGRLQTAENVRASGGQNVRAGRGMSVSEGPKMSAPAGQASKRRLFLSE
jgi:hypothetical protein